MFIKYVNILVFEREYTLAIDLLEEKTKSDSLNLTYLSLLGDYYYQIDSLESSVKVLEKQINLNPNDQKNLSKLASFYIKIQRFDKAIQTCDIGLQSDSLNLKFIRTKGIAGFKNKNYKLSGDCFQMLLSEGDSGKFILKHLGVSQFRNSMFKESREHLLLAYQADSNDFETNYFLGNAFLNSQEPEIGLFYLNRADSLLQPNPIVLSTIYTDKQSIYSTIGNYNEALRCYEKAYEYDPKPEFIFYIASLYQHKLDDKKKALEYYERFIGLLPPKPASEHKFDEKQIVISLRKAAETNIIQLKEELFFKGELKN
jgi:tetratricopeptide (TPR) repeat protein